MVKGGLFQARPYCSIEKERYNLGTFKTRAQARTAILEFWKTGKGERPKFVRPIRKKDGTVYAAMFTFQIGKFATPTAASQAVKEFVEQVFGAEAAAAMLSRGWRDGKGRTRDGKGRARGGDIEFMRGGERRAKGGGSVGDGDEDEPAGGFVAEGGGETLAVGHLFRRLPVVDADGEDFEDASGAADDTDLEDDEAAPVATPKRTSKGKPGPRFGVLGPRQSRRPLDD